MLFEPYTTHTREWTLSHVLLWKKKSKQQSVCVKRTWSGNGIIEITLIENVSKHYTMRIFAFMNDACRMFVSIFCLPNFITNSHFIENSTQWNHLIPFNVYFIFIDKQNVHLFERKSYWFYTEWNISLPSNHISKRD